MGGTTRLPCQRGPDGSAQAATRVRSELTEVGRAWCPQSRSSTPMRIIACEVMPRRSTRSGPAGQGMADDVLVTSASRAARRSRYVPPQAVTDGVRGGMRVTAMTPSPSLLSQLIRATIVGAGASKRGAQENGGCPGRTRNVVISIVGGSSSRPCSTARSTDRTRACTQADVAQMRSFAVATARLGSASADRGTHQPMREPLCHRARVSLRAKISISAPASPRRTSR